MPSDDLEVLLTDAQIADWRERGFTHVDRLTTDAEVDWLRDRFDEVFDPSNKGLIGGYFDASAPITADIADVPDLGQYIRPELKWPDLVETIAHRNAMRIASQLLDVPVDGLETWTHMIDKPPRPRPRDALAPGRSVLGGAPRLPRLRRVARPRRRRP